jgi:fructose-1,6-bisphosphatase I
MTASQTLDAYLAVQSADPAVIETVRGIARACVAISRTVAQASLTGKLGASGAVNVQDEDQKQLDVIANDVLSDALSAIPAVAGYASEELESAEPTGRHGGVLVTFDPLDGSSNIDVNVSIGTIFSLLPAPRDRASDQDDFLQPGRNQLAAGYVVYGPQTSLALTVGADVAAFSLSANGDWLLTHERLVVPPETKEFAINMSNQRHWSEGVRRYIDGCLAGKDGRRGKDFNMRWVGSMVADVHRILMRGGVFLYPWDAREPGKPGKLRLLYEGAPMALLVERAEGAATDGSVRLLDVVPTSLHQRVPVVLGSREEVQQVHSA